jgi:DNA primase
MKKDHVQEIKDRLAINDVISSYVKIEKAGANFKARCPFHNEKTPSFFINPERGTYYCFGCGEKGDAFSFVEKFEGLDFKGALKVLAEKAGVILEPMSSRESGDDKDKLYRILEEATVFFETELEKTPEAKEYILSRGLTPKTLKEMRIGYAPNDWRRLRTHLLSKKYRDEDVLSVGLIKKTDKATSDPLYDVFRGRVMFPISDSSGRVVAFSGRIVVDDEKSPKYLNSPETTLFVKSKVLYGLDKAKSSIRTRNYAILVEGQMDMVMSHQAGFTNTVAVSGTAFSESGDTDGAVSGIGLVTRISKNLIIAFDSDEAGYKATLRAGKIALGMGMDVKIAHIIGGKDPADIIKVNPVTWGEMVKNSTPIIPFIVAKVKSLSPDKKKLGVLIKMEVLPYIALHESSIEQSRLVEYIAGETGIKSDALWEDLRKVSIEKSSNIQFVQKIDEMSRLEQIERKVFGIINLYKNKTDRLSIPISRVRALVGDTTYNWYESLPPTELSTIMTAIEVMYGEKGIEQKEFDELLLLLEKEHVKKKREGLSGEIKKAQTEKNNEREQELLKEHQLLSKKIHEIDLSLTHK